jgi:hypothetical protein
VCEVSAVNDFQFENLVKGVESCFKQNYCALYFGDLVRKFSPEITEDELRYAIKSLCNRGQLVPEGSLMRLIVK